MAPVQLDVRDLLKAGVHFGHRAAHWHPGMAPYVYGQRNGIYIIDLIKTVDQLEQALDFVETTAASGKQILFVGTKRHLRPAVKAAAEAAHMPFVTERWFGGTLTNFSTISKRVKYLKDREAKLASGELAESMSKRELAEAREEMAKLNVMFGGLKTMTELPKAVFVADLITDRIAAREANSLEIPVVGIVDTNADPSQVNYVIAANDDAVSSVALISNLVAEAAKRGRARPKATTPPKAEPKAKTVKPPEASSKKPPATVKKATPNAKA